MFFKSKIRSHNKKNFDTSRLWIRHFTSPSIRHVTQTITGGKSNSYALVTKIVCVKYKNPTKHIFVFWAGARVVRDVRILQTGVVFYEPPWKCQKRFLRSILGETTRSVHRMKTDHKISPRKFEIVLVVVDVLSANHMRIDVFNTSVRDTLCI